MIRIISCRDILASYLIHNEWHEFLVMSYSWNGSLPMLNCLQACFVIHSLVRWRQKVDLATRNAQETKMWRLWENRRTGCRWKYGQKYCLNPPVRLQAWLRFMLLLLHSFGTSGALHMIVKGKTCSLPPSSSHRAGTRSYFACTYQWRLWLSVMRPLLMVQWQCTTSCLVMFVFPSEICKVWLCIWGLLRAVG